jgi:hypothetical protein
VVQIPAKERCLPEQERRDAGPRRLRPGNLRAGLHRRVPEQHGGSRGWQSEREAGEDLHNGAEKQLHDLAVCADGELQARAARTSLAVCQYYLYWVELLLELLEQLVIDGQGGELWLICRGRWWMLTWIVRLPFSSELPELPHF